MSIGTLWEASHFRFLVVTCFVTCFVVGALPALGQVFELREATWGPLAYRAQPSPGIVELVALFLIFEGLLIAVSIGLLVRRAGRLRQMPRRVDHQESWLDLVRTKKRNDRWLHGIAFVVAPVLGVFGSLLGRGFSLQELDVSSLLAGGGLVVLSISAIDLFFSARESLLLGQLRAHLSH